MATTTEDHLFLERAKKKDKEVKKDERIISQVETISDKIDILDDKERIELEKIEKSRDYFRNQIDQASNTLNTEIRILRESYEKKLQYFNSHLEQLDTKEESIRERFDKLRGRKEIQKTRLAEKVTTNKGKDLLAKTESKSPPSEPEVSITEEQQARKFLNDGGSWWAMAEKFPNYYRQQREIEKSQEKEKMKTPEVQDRLAKHQAELLLAREKEREREEKLAKLNLKVKESLEALKLARSKGEDLDAIEDLRAQYSAAQEELSTQKYLFTKGL